MKFLLPSILSSLTPKCSGARPKPGLLRPGRWIGLAGLLIWILVPAARAQGVSVATNPAPMTAAVFTSTNANSLDDKYRLVIGDQLSYRVVEDEEDPRLLVVTDSGEIEVPYLGRYPAAGKTCKQLATELKNELEKKYYYQASVVIAVNAMPRSRGKVYLVGAVRSPGPQDLASDETLTVSKAILRAGGFSNFANERKVKVTRATGNRPDDIQTFLVDVQSVLEKSNPQNDLVLQPGDFIYVPERLIRF